MQENILIIILIALILLISFKKSGFGVFEKCTMNTPCKAGYHCNASQPWASRWASADCVPVNNKCGDEGGHPPCDNGYYCDYCGNTNRRPSPSCQIGMCVKEQ